MLQVFGDESHDPKSGRVFAAAGLFGTQEQWSAFGERWTERLADRVFHASDCETDHGEFAGMDHSENLKLYADLTTPSIAVGRADRLRAWLAKLRQPSETIGKVVQMVSER